MLPADILRRVRRLHLRASRVVRSHLGGAYQSAFKGSGLLFEEVRPYQPGDDVRAIEWNVTARVGVPFVKRFVEERELSVVLAVDVSASQRFGSGVGTKRAVAAEIAALLALCAAHNNDRVGLMAFTDAVERSIPPGKGVRHVRKILHDLLTFEPRRPGTDLAGALDILTKVHLRRAVVVVISDFLGRGFDAAFRRTARKHDLIAVRTADPLEWAWPPVGLVRLRDAESGRDAAIDSSNRAFRTTFDARGASRGAAFEKFAREAGADLIEVDSAGNHLDVMIEFFRTRNRRRRRG